MMKGGKVVSIRLSCWSLVNMCSAFGSSIGECHRSLVLRVAVYTDVNVTGHINASVNASLLAETSEPRWYCLDVNIYCHRIVLQMRLSSRSNSSCDSWSMMTASSCPSQFLPQPLLTPTRYGIPLLPSRHRTVSSNAPDHVNQRFNHLDYRHCSHPRHRFPHP